MSLGTRDDKACREDALALPRHLDIVLRFAPKAPTVEVEQVRAIKRADPVTSRAPEIARKQKGGNTGGPAVRCYGWSIEATDTQHASESRLVNFLLATRLPEIGSGHDDGCVLQIYN